MSSPGEPAHRMLRRLLLGVTVALAIAAPAFGQGLQSRKEAVDARLDRLQAQIEAARSREASLAAEIEATTSRIRTLESQVGDVSRQLVHLEHDLALHRERLARLKELYRLQTRRFGQLTRDFAAAQAQFERRLIAIYQEEDITALDVVLQATSLTDLLERLDYSRQIGSQDEQIAHQLGSAKAEVRAARARTKRTKAAVASATRVIAVRTGQVRAARNRLLARQSALSASRGEQQHAIASVRQTEREAASEAAALERSSAELAAQIHAAAQRAAAAQAAARAAARSSAQATPSGSSAAAPVADSTASSSGLIWPVSGPVVSGFGMRWGRMHEGIDIAAGTGTPIRAAASGIVIYAGWMGGYGNLIIIDHGGSLATAYAHLSGFAVGSGASVSQGQTIGSVGCTGHCYGPHLHFAVRVNVTAGDPTGYL